MDHRSLCAALIVAGICQAVPSAATGASLQSLDIVDSASVEPSDVIAEGGSFRDPGDPFWQLVIDRTGIELNGAASPNGPSLVKLAPVRSRISGATETWVTRSGETKVEIRVVRERCVRADGLVFRQKVTIETGARVLVTCGSRGSDPEPTKV